jgi:hypothetical protein
MQYNLLDPPSLHTYPNLPYHTQPYPTTYLYTNLYTYLDYIYILYQFPLIFL